VGAKITHGKPPFYNHTKKCFPKPLSGLFVHAITLGPQKKWEKFPGKTFIFREIPNTGSFLWKAKGPKLPEKPRTNWEKPRNKDFKKPPMESKKVKFNPEFGNQCRNPKMGTPRYKMPGASVG